MSHTVLETGSLRKKMAAGGVFGHCPEWQQRFAGSIGKQLPGPVLIQDNDGPRGDGMPEELIPGVDCD